VASSRYDLVQDKKGACWDLVLYIPTIVFLIMVGTKLWYSGDQNLTYMIAFSTTIITLIGFNRIMKTRLMLLPKAPVALEISKKQVTLELRNGEKSELVKDVKFFSDLAGKSFGLTGCDLAGKRQQYVFHKLQFGTAERFSDAKAVLRAFS